MNEDTKYRSREAYTSDVEILMDCSFRTAQRWLAKIHRHYQIPKYQRPTLEQVKAYLVPKQRVKI